MKRTIIILTSIFSVAFCFDATISAANRKHPFSAKEDALIVALRADPNRSWGQIAKHFPQRTARHVRERWKNHLDPNRGTDNWTPAGEQEAVRLFKLLGPKWTRICNSLEEKHTVVDVMNCCKRLTRRSIRRTRDESVSNPDEPPIDLERQHQPDDTTEPNPVYYNHSDNPFSEAPQAEQDEDSQQQIAAFMAGNY